MLERCAGRSETFRTRELGAFASFRVHWHVVNAFVPYLAKCYITRTTWVSRESLSKLPVFLGVARSNRCMELAHALFTCIQALGKLPEGFCAHFATRSLSTMLIDAQSVVIQLWVGSHP